MSNNQYLNELIKVYSAQIDRIKVIKDSIEEVLISKGIDISDKTFLGLANSIYNINNEEELSFIDKKYDIIPGEVGEEGLNNKIDLLEYVKLSLFNVLRAKGVEIEDNTPLDEYDIYIDSVSSSDRILPLSFTSSATLDYGQTEIIIEDKLDNYNYYYNLSGKIPVYGKVYSSQYGFNEIPENNIVEVDKYGTLFISVIEVDENNLVTRAGCIHCVQKQYITATNISDKINMIPGDEEFECNIDRATITGDLYYKEYLGDVVFQDDPFNSDGYILLSEDSVYFESNKKLFFVLVEDGRVKGYAIKETIIRTSAYELESYSFSGSEKGYTNIEVDNILAEGNKYLIIKESIIPLYLEYIDPTKCIEWDGVSEIELPHGIIITILEVDEKDRIKKYSNLKINSNVQFVPTLNGVTSCGSGEDDYTIIKIDPIKEESKYYYIESMDYEVPPVNTEINSNYIEFIPGEAINIKNKTRVLIVEVIDFIIVSAVFHSVNSTIPSIDYIKINTVIGSVAGYTKVNSEYELKEDEEFFYAKGTIATAYDYDTQGFNHFDINKELFGFKDFDIITVIVAKLIDGDYKVRKVGYTTVYVKPIELLPLSIASRRGTIGEHSIITISPKLTKGNKYKYFFTKDIPGLYDDVSSWYDWDGISEIKAENDITICVAECTSENLVLKVGTTIVRAKDPDPVLGVLIVTSEAGINDGCTKITVEPPLEDGYQYAYKIGLYDLPDYHTSAIDWSAWNGKAEIEAISDTSICIAECTTDGYIVKAGITRVNSK